MSEQNYLVNTFTGFNRTLEGWKHGLEIVTFTIPLSFNRTLEGWKQFVSTLSYNSISGFNRTLEGWKQKYDLSIEELSE